MLYLIGLGLSEGDLSLKGMKALRQADQIFAEFYTAPNVFDLSSVEEKVGQQIEILNRKQVEERFFELSEEPRVALLVPGDPLIATTHFELYKQAQEREEEVKVIHAPSIYSAVAATGLSLYKFGRTVTLPQPTAEFFPSSPYQLALTNFENKMHTLILLDKEMDAIEALQMVRKLEEDCGDGLFVSDRQLLVVERLGSPNQQIHYTKLKQLTGKTYGAKPHSLILPADLAHKEREYLYLKRGN